MFPAVCVQLTLPYSWTAQPRFHSVHAVQYKPCIAAQHDTTTRLPLIFWHLKPMKVLHLCVLHLDQSDGLLLWLQAGWPPLASTDLRTSITAHTGLPINHTSVVNDAVPPAAWLATRTQATQLPALCLVLGTAVAVSVWDGCAPDSSKARVMVPTRWGDARIGTASGNVNVHDALGTGGRAQMGGDATRCACTARHVSNCASHCWLLLMCGAPEHTDGHCIHPCCPARKFQMQMHVCAGSCLAIL